MTDRHRQRTQKRARHRQPRHSGRGTGSQGTAGIGQERESELYA